MISKKVEQSLLKLHRDKVNEYNRISGYFAKIG